MICKNCGGEVVFQNGVGMCSSCGAQIKFDGAFENTEVYICYTENDSAGRRVKDSMIANEIYNKLENAKIETFYERASSGNLAGDALEITRYQAIYNAKVIIMLGTTPDYFNQLFEKNSKYFEGKAVLPVCVDMSPAQLPQQLAKYQAANYNSVGADADLIKTVLKALGREEEITLGEVMTKAQRQKKRLITAVIIAVVVLILGVGAFFAVNHYLNSDDRSLEKNYNSAITLVEQEKYLEAAKKFSSILDYKDSEKQFKKIYDRYDGYYLNDGQACALYLNIIDGKTAEFSFEKTIDNKIVKITDSMVLENNEFSGTYVDNLSNEGNIIIVLSDNKIKVDIDTTVIVGEISIGDINVEFQVENKTDRPTTKTVTREILLDWMTNPTYVDDIKAAGYELEYIDYSSPYDTPYGKNYKITNTDITIIATNQDLTKNNGENFYDLLTLDGDIVVAVVAPMSVAYPEKVGQSACVFAENEIVYVPNGSYLFYSGSDGQLYLNFPVPVFSPNNNSTVSATMNELVVSADSMVGITSKKLVGEYNYNSIVDENNEIYYRTLVLEQYYKDNPNINEKSYILIEILLDQDDALLVCVHEVTSANNIIGETNGSYNYYKVDLTTQKVSFIIKQDDAPYYNSYGSLQYSYDGWKTIPEITEKFGIETEKTDKETSSTEIAIDPETYFVGCHYDVDGVNYLDITGSGEEYSVTISIGNIYCSDIYAAYGEEVAVLEFEHISDNGSAFSGTIRRKGANIILKITESDINDLPIDSEYKFLL